METEDTLDDTENAVKDQNQDESSAPLPESKGEESKETESPAEQSESKGI